jgi:hypothetical protein
MKGLVSALLFVIFGSLASMPLLGGLGEAPSSPPTWLSPKVTFIVGDSMPNGQGTLEGVRVRLIKANGVVLDLGKTTVQGELSVERGALETGLFLVFSREGFFDGAWELDQLTRRRAKECYIQLARFAVL